MKILIVLIAVCCCTGCSLTITIQKPQHTPKLEQVAKEKLDEDYEPTPLIMSDRWGKYYKMPIAK